MSSNGKVYDVFFTYSFADADVAERVRRPLEAAGLRIGVVEQFRADDDAHESMMHALAESGAFLAVLSPETVGNSSIAVEMGAAWAWKKPIYVIAEDVESVRAAPLVRNAQLFSLRDIDELVFEIRRSLSPMSATERDALIAAYSRLRVPTDRLVLDPAAVDKLAKLYNRGQRRTVAGERLVRELIRLRKQGQLPRVRKVG